MDFPKVPENTSKKVKENPVGFLAEGMVLGASGAIEHQEAEGQSSFVESETLPTKMAADAKTALEATGVKFGAVVDGDPLFQFVTLPKGWKKIPTDHSMWSKLVDETGRERASIFYKAAFYDRRASLNLCS